ncbi:hypothetical protein BTM29_06080 [Companilactobacillus allii]|uniref:GGDEF domain-containing protein n=2 Tax=Companilactobacillus allii TaxID=1847728 RepID=A0A1P8Q672_9LACO|nr:hypothetical protein BTM29_06080 [Companilactobacillus allii]
MNYGFNRFQSLLINNSINVIIIGLVTIGIITIITLMAYSFESIVRHNNKPIQKFILQLIEGLVLTISLILIQRIFATLSSGDMHSWFYTATELTILLFSLYTMQNHIIELINMVAPISIFGYRAVTGYNDYLVLFSISIILLALTVIYIYHNMEKILSSQKKFIIVQAIYGSLWWIIIWPFRKFALYYTVLMVIGFIIYMSLIRYLAKRIRDSFNRYSNLSKQVNYDELTGIRNRASFDEVSQEVFKVYHKNSGVPLSIAMFDIDNFKRFNDTYGHLAGDKVLTHVATLFERQLFKETTGGQLFRYGGEEFVIIFRGLTADQSVQTVEDIRNKLINDPLNYNGQELNIRISFGITEIKDTDTSFKDLFERVDDYLYKSKDSGRDRLTSENKTINFYNI